MIKTIKVTNFKKHERLSLEFGPGLTTICGSNYSGKSTILQAILFSLFGSSAVPGGSGVIKGRKSDKPAQAILGFSIQGREYRIERTTGKVRLFRGDDLIASSASAVTEAVEELLGMSKKRFLDLKYSEQKRTEHMLTVGGTELHAIIEEISGADLVTEVIAKATDIASQCKGGLDALPEVDLPSLKEDLKTLAEAVETSSQKLKALDQQLAKAFETLEGAKQARSKAQRNNSLRRELTEKVSQAQEGLAIAKAAHAEAMADYNDNREMAKRYDRYKEKKTELENKISKAVQINKEFEDLDTRGKALSKLLEAKQEKLDELKATLLSLDFDPARLFQLREQLAEADSIHKQELKAYKQICNSLDDAYCHACKRPLDGAHIEELKKQKEEGAKRLEAAASEAGKLSNQVNELAEVEERWGGLQKEITALASYLNAKGEELEGIQQAADKLDGKTKPQKVIDEWKVDLQVVTEKFSLAIAAKDRVTQAGKKSEQANNRINLLTKQIEEVGEIPEEIALPPLDESVERSQQTVDGLKSEHRDALSSRQFAEHRHAEISEQIDKAEKVISKRRHLEGRLKTSQELTKYLRKNRDRFLMEIWEGVMGYASHFVSSCTDNAIESVSRQEDGKFTYVEAGETMPIEAASGAQRSLMGLGVQMALSQMLPTAFDGVLLDEPTSDMDEERSMAMALMLANSKSQVLMVSHRQMDNSVASHNITLGGVQ